jgi:hypothetical protein
MGTVTVVNHLTLDGVMQAPAGPDEDRRGGFDRGGWAFANAERSWGRSSPTGPLEWQGSSVLQGDDVDAVRDLRASTDLTILGSGELIRSLIPHGLIDRYLLMIHPVVLGRRVRMFGDCEVALELERSVTTTTGVVIATYRVVRG